MLTDFLGIAALTVLIVLIPGPDLALIAHNTVAHNTVAHNTVARNTVVRNTDAGGKGAGGWTSAGIVTGNLVRTAHCMLAVGSAIANSIVAFTILKLADGAYRIFLGLQSQRPTPEAAQGSAPPRRRNRHWPLRASGYG